MKYTILVALTLFGAEAIADEYYGYLGNCAQTAYEFNFSAGEYKVYSKNEFKMSGRVQVSYGKNSGKISKEDDVTYLMHTDKFGDIRLSLKEDSKNIQGESEAYGKHYYGLCDSEDVAEWVAKAKNS